MKTTVLLASTLALALLAGCNKPDGNPVPTPTTADNTSTSAPLPGSALSAPPSSRMDPALADGQPIDSGRDTSNLPAPAAPDTANAPNSPPNPQSAPQPPDQPQVSNPRDAKNYAG